MDSSKKNEKMIKLFLFPFINISYFFDLFYCINILFLQNGKKMFVIIMLFIIGLIIFSSSIILSFYRSIIISSSKFLRLL